MSLTLSFRTPQENIWKNGKYKYKYYDNYYSFNIYNDLYNRYDIDFAFVLFR